MNPNPSRENPRRQASAGKEKRGCDRPTAARLRRPGLRGPLAAVAVGLLVLGLLAAGCQSPTGPHPAVGRAVGEVELAPLLDTQEALDRDQLVGNVTLLHFWGTWCGPCRVEYPELLKTFADLQSVDGFRFVTVSCPGSPATAFEDLQSETAAYYEELGASVPTHADPQGLTQQSVANLLNHPGMVYPTTLLLDRRGIVRGVWEGYHPDGVAQMHEAATDLLETAPTT